jgi:hypothetical protein
MIRLYLYCPVNTENEILASQIFINSLQKHIDSPPRPTDITGFTHRYLEKAMNHGYYWSTDNRRWISDVVVVFYCDLFLSDPELQTIVEELKKEFFRCYNDSLCPQEAVWCVVHPIDVR